MQRLAKDFKPLNIDPAIDWISTQLASELLGIHPSQLRRDRAVLAYLDLINHTPRSIGFRRETLETLWIFRQLVNQRGRSEAITQITTILEKHHERER